MGNPLWLYDESDVYHWLRFPATHPNVLRSLAGHSSVGVRQGVARHPNCPLDVLITLASDVVEVRRICIYNDNATEQVYLTYRATNLLLRLELLCDYAHTARYSIDYSPYI